MLQHTSWMDYIGFIYKQRYLWQWQLCILLWLKDWEDTWNESKEVRVQRRQTWNRSEEDIFQHQRQQQWVRWYKQQRSSSSKWWPSGQ